MTVSEFLLKLNRSTEIQFQNRLISVENFNDNGKNIPQDCLFFEQN